MWPISYKITWVTSALKLGVLMRRSLEEYVPSEDPGHEGHDRMPPSVGVAVADLLAGVIPMEEVQNRGSDLGRTVDRESFGLARHHMVHTEV